MITDSITQIGDTQYVLVDTTANVVTFTTTTNTFYITNGSDSRDTYVGVFDNYDQAAAITTSGDPLLPSESKVIQGSFDPSIEPRVVYAGLITTTLEPGQDEGVFIAPVIVKV
jgi:hypothetical protein